MLYIKSISKIAMAGHSHWAGIKRQKESTDKKRARVFSKLLAAVSVAAREEPNPDFNPRLRDAVANAKANMVPAENIVRAINRASDAASTVDELVLEAYGPGGSAIIIAAATDNRNRTVAEIKAILHSHLGKWAEPGSVRWGFEPPPPGETVWTPRFPLTLSAEDSGRLSLLVAALQEQGDVQSIFTNHPDNP